MNPDDDVFLGASAIAVLAILNWIAGDRPVFGMPIVLRSGSFWIASRWLGLGLFAASFAAVRAEIVPTVSWIALFGAVTILVGTARKRSSSPVSLRPNRKQEAQQVEDADAG